MHCERRGLIRYGWAGFLLAAALLRPPLQAAPLPADLLSDDASAYESRGLWGRAAEAWALVLGKDRGNSEARDHYQTCLRHIHQVRRLRDSAFQDDIPTRPLAEALRFYLDVLTQVRENYAEKQRATPEVLFRQGVLEFQFALADAGFLEKHLDPHPGCTCRSSRLAWTSG